MKKLILSLAAAATLMGCATDEVINSSRDAIAFDGAWVDNSTRAAYDDTIDTNSLEEFQVWATITGHKAGANGTANIFQGEVVSKNFTEGTGNTWKYSSANTQYWIPGNDYHFIAVANGNIPDETSVVALPADNYMATQVKVQDASKQNDVLVAKYDVTPYETPANGAAPDAVRFEFAHILSKVKFTVKNTISTNNGYSYKVDNITIRHAFQDGIYTIIDGQSGTWETRAKRYDLDFGKVVAQGNADNNAEVANIGYGAQAESNYERLVIPHKGAINVKFHYTLLKDGAPIDEQEIILDTPSLNFEQGKAYNLLIKLGNPGEAITFELDKVKGWDNGNTADGDGDGVKDNTPAN